ncbi:Chorion transcription factor Cf2 [Portunus trituberculatus]|uniref:Chorion transcription factor Cf2 n=1 Tax=Portunus trituberculatus TaxID=210409 RepID=A0A5B7DTD1_PORTR|nr:Chorion transcription factor Cf2 [Portunus trituberculatus]
MAGGVPDPAAQHPPPPGQLLPPQALSPWAPTLPHDQPRVFKCPYCQHRRPWTGESRRPAPVNLSSRSHEVVVQAECRQWLQQLSRVGVVAGKAKVTCPLCGKVCSRSDKLKLHLRTHTGERPYLCTYCDHRSRTSDDLKRHVRTHTGERPYQCPFCPYRASDPSTIRSHKKHRHHELFHQARLAAQQQQDQTNG